jgi:hypothetical protein
MRKRYTLILVDPEKKRGNARSFVMAYNEQEARVLGKRMYPQYQIKEAFLEDGLPRLPITGVREATLKSIQESNEQLKANPELKEKYAKSAESICNWIDAMDEVENE